MPLFLGSSVTQCVGPIHREMMTVLVCSIWSMTCLSSHLCQLSLYMLVSLIQPETGLTLWRFFVYWRLYCDWVWGLIQFFFIFGCNFLFLSDQLVKIRLRSRPNVNIFVILSVLHVPVHNFDQFDHFRKYWIKHLSNIFRVYTVTQCFQYTKKITVLIYYWTM